MQKLQQSWRGFPKILDFLLLFSITAGLGTSIIPNFIISDSLGAQDAEIAVEDAGVYEAPDSNSTVLEQLSQGTRIRISNDPTDGWYKTLLSQPVDGKKTGWVQESDINVNPIDTKAKKTKKKKKKKKKRASEDEEENGDEAPMSRRNSKRPKFPFIAQLSYVMGKTSPEGYQSKIGINSKSFYATQFGARVMYKAYPEYLFGGSMEFYSFSEAGTPSATGATGTIKYKATATLITALAEYEFYQKAPFFFGVGAGFGGVFGKAGNTTALGTTIETTSLFSLQFNLKAFARAYFAKRWSGQFDLGYRKMEFTEVPILNTTNELTGAKINADLDLSGLSFGFVVGYDF